MKLTTRRLSVVVGLLAGASVLPASAVAVASGPAANAAATQYVSVFVPSRAAAGHTVRAIISGRTSVTEDLEYNVDRRPCARLFRLERARRTRSTGLGRAVRGRFRVTARITNAPRGSNYVCAYLTPHSASIRTLAHGIGYFFVSSASPSFTG